MGDKCSLYDLCVFIVEYCAAEDCLPLIREESSLKISQYIYESVLEGETVYKEFFIDTACMWLQHQTKTLADYVEPHARNGGRLAYDIYQAQVQISRQKTIMH